VQPGEIDHEALEGIAVERGQETNAKHRSRKSGGLTPDMETLEAIHIDSGVVITGLYRTDDTEERVWFDPFQEQWVDDPR
jgi:hypothetical protein